MKLRLYDTYTRSLRDFEPLEPGQVGLYSCGPTVYDYAHIGNLRTYVFVDLLRRTLKFNGYAVKHVMNITDVGHLVSDADTGEDKMEVGSRRTGKTAWQIAEEYTVAFQEDIRQLNILEPTIWCKATDHITEQIEMVQCLEENGYTYRTADGIYFDTSRLDDYGYLARLDIAGLQAGARVELGEKHNPTDFALWKFSRPDEQRQMEWDSPWGVGFPGWHIECSAMSAKYLGSYFDIHCGGEDHKEVVMDLLWFLLIGLAAGWLAGQLFKGRSFGLVGNLIIGVIGAYIGGGLFSLLGISGGGGLIGSLITATVGAIVLLFVVRTLKKA
jgi:cysteinyl-tRNA synthetase